MTQPNAARRPSRESLAVAWDMEGALGMPFVVRENGDIALEPEALDEWWAKNRQVVMSAYDEYHPAGRGS